MYLTQPPNARIIDRHYTRPIQLKVESYLPVYIKIKNLDKVHVLVSFMSNLSSSAVRDASSELDLFSSLYPVSNSLEEIEAEETC